MRIFQTSQADHAGSAKMDRPPTPRADTRCAYFPPTTRARQCGHTRLSICERAGSNINDLNDKPPDNSARHADPSPPHATSARERGPWRRDSYERAVGLPHCHRREPPANRARLRAPAPGSKPTWPRTPARLSCEKPTQTTPNAAITRAGSTARFERRACSGVGLIAQLEIASDFMDADIGNLRI